MGEGACPQPDAGHDGAGGYLPDRACELCSVCLKDLVVFGGVRLAQQLVSLGLVDIFDLALNPVILGEGQPLFTQASERQVLELLDCQTFMGKAVALRYGLTGERRQV